MFLLNRSVLKLFIIEYGKSEKYGKIFQNNYWNKIKLEKRKKNFTMHCKSKK